MEPNATYTDADGVVFEWDNSKRAYFPKIDETFMAQYQLNYGAGQWVANQDDRGNTYYFNTQTGDSRWDMPQGYVPPAPRAGPVASPSTPVAAGAGAGAVLVSDASATAGPAGKPASGGKRKRKAAETVPGSDTDAARAPVANLRVYVQGLPLDDFTEDDLAKFMAKCGIVALDDDGKPKVKLYRNADNTLKGDGLCRYLKAESVALALQLLDGAELRPGLALTVTRAVFEEGKGVAAKDGAAAPAQSGEPQPGKKKKTAAQVKENRRQQRQLLSWDDAADDAAAAGELKQKKKKAQGVLVLKRVFTPDAVDEDSTVLNDIKDAMQSECSKYGVVKKIMIFDRHPDGVVSVRFEQEAAALLCMEKFNGRLYDGRRLEAAMWDGRTNFKIEESDLERDARLEKWNTHLEGSDNSDSSDSGSSESDDN